MKTDLNKRTRFERDPFDLEVRLAKLKDEAPGLGGGKRLRIYALVGSFITAATVTGLYYTVNIYKALHDEDVELQQIEVEMAEEYELPEHIKVLNRLEQEALEAEAQYEQDLANLKQVDLLNELQPID